MDRCTLRSIFCCCCCCCCLLMMMCSCTFGCICVCERSRAHPFVPCPQWWRLFVRIFIILPKRSENASRLNNAAVSWCNKQKFYSQNLRIKMNIRMCLQLHCKLKKEIRAFDELCTIFARNVNFHVGSVVSIKLKIRNRGQMSIIWWNHFNW